MTDPKKTEAVETAKGEMAETELSDPDLDGVAGGLRGSVCTGRATCGTPSTNPGGTLESGGGTGGGGGG